MAKVFVAMSGGVDSSVAAALLKRQGYDVTGVFIKIDVGTECDWREERRDAMRAAARLGIPLTTFDLSDAYQKSVIDYLVNEYRIGRTPNPDVMCNQQIKFGEFFREARRHGADLIATGHYAVVRREDDFATPGRKGGVVIKSSSRLLVSKDKNKDQTYFLWPIKPEILARCLFPIGDYQKSEVRMLARRFGLPNAEKPDSQGLCFLGQINFKDFLAKQLPEKIGAVLNEKGETIGAHRGAHFYTVGERHGLEIKRKTPFETAYYVAAKDVEKNTLTAVPRARFNDWASGEIILTNTNWFADVPDGKLILQARIRHGAPLASCRLYPASSNSDRWRLVFSKPQAAVAPGQSCVIYHKNICLGGGVIV